MKHFNRKWTHAAVLAATVWTTGAAVAQEQQPEHSISYNVAVTSDYRYRGLSQTRLDPAVSAGADYTHNPTGFYVGTWASSIKWTKDIGGDGNVEWDIYGGKRGNLGADITYDVGGLYYFYPDNGLHPNANTFELYGQLGYGPAYVKYSHSTTNLFGAPDSKQSGYLDVGANVDVGNGFVVNVHAGHQRIRNNSALSYSDYKIGVTKDLGVCSIALAWIKADIVSLSPDGKNLGKSAALLTVSKTF
jgi:uncharacterized protein (TIGR02001 family)